MQSIARSNFQCRINARFQERI